MDITLNPATQDDVDQAAYAGALIGMTEYDDTVIQRAALEELEDALVEHAWAAHITVERGETDHGQPFVIVRVTHSGKTGTVEHRRVK